MRGLARNGVDEALLMSVHCVSVDFQFISLCMGFGTYGHTVWYSLTRESLTGEEARRGGEAFEGLEFSYLHRKIQVLVEPI